MSGIVVSITVIVLFLLIYKLVHNYLYTCEIIEKVSVPFGNKLKYYFIIKRVKSRKTLRVNVTQEIYDSYKIHDLIIVD